MAQVSLNNLSGFNYEAADFSYFANVLATPNFAQWQTGGMFFIDAYSFPADFTYVFGPSAPFDILGGSLDVLSISLGVNQSITAMGDLPALGQWLAPSDNVVQARDGLWSAVMGGASDVTVTGTGFSTVSLDFLELGFSPFVQFGANDTLTIGAGNFTSAFIGDAERITNVFLVAGNDTFTSSAAGSGLSLIGDANFVEVDSTLLGGDDSFVLTGPKIYSTMTSGSYGLIAGDAQFVVNSDMTGGNDTITLAGRGMVASVITGDAVSLFDSTLAGGDDTITVGSDDFILESPNPNLLIAGDLSESSSTGSIIGGNDSITLRNLSASIGSIAGDFMGLAGTVGDVAIGGDDTITVINDALPLTGTPYSLLVPPVLSISTITGDGGFVSDVDSVVGGDDTLTIIGTVGLIRGDYENVATGADNVTVTGGDDAISVLNTSSASSFIDIVGDVAGISTAGTTTLMATGGDDSITYVTTGDTQVLGGLVFGDFGFVNGQDGVLTGGDDQITLDESQITAFQTYTGITTLQGDFGDVEFITGGTVHFGDDTITGGAGADNIQGDTLAANLLNATVLTHGNDVLDGRGGNDTLNGGGGTDRAVFGDGQAVYVNLNGIPTSSGNVHAIGQGIDTLISIENVRGSVNNDIIIGDGADNDLHGWLGNDKVDGGSGNDTLTGGSGNDTLTGGAGIDSYFGGNGTDTIVFIGSADWAINLDTGIANTLISTETMSSFENAVGSSGNNLITGTSSFNDLYGGAGDDTLIGNGGVDDFYGGTGYDTADNSASNSAWFVDMASSFATVTTLSNTVNNATIDSIERFIGAKNFNTILGTGADEEYIGQNFDDFFLTGGGFDSFTGGTGSDTVNFLGNGQDLTVFLTSGTVQYGASGPTTSIIGIENAYGFVGNDRITGTSGSNELRGGDGNDTLSSGSGQDILVGGAGNDRLSGGNQADTFVFELDNSQDVITDFVDGVDMIQLSGWGLTSSAQLSIINTTVGGFSGALIGQIGNTTTIFAQGATAAMFTDADFLF